MSASKAVYLDPSAIVKLVVSEEETEALQNHLRRRKTLVSSALTRTEVLRSVLPFGEPARKTADQVFDRLELLRINDRILRSAAALPQPGLRSLDAIHLATAIALEDDLSYMVCYDTRMSEAAATTGIAVQAPA